jgi:hypothetical protein
MGAALIRPLACASGHHLRFQRHRALLYVGVHPEASLFVMAMICFRTLVRLCGVVRCTATEKSTFACSASLIDKRN